MKRKREKEREVVRGEEEMVVIVIDEHCGVCDKRIFYFGDVPQYRIIWRVAVSRVIRGNHDDVGDPLDSSNRC